MRLTLTTIALTALAGLATPAFAQAPALGKSPTKAKAPAGEDAAAESDGLVKMMGDTLVDAEGKTFKTADVLAGRKNVILYFTASWCGPCRVFTPELVKFADANKDAKDFVIVMVGSDRNAAAQDGYMKKAKMPFYAIPYGSPGVRAVKSSYAGGGIPNLVVLDATGKVVKGSYETDGKYTPRNRRSYIGPKPVLEAFQKMQKDASSTKG